MSWPEVRAMSRILNAVGAQIRLLRKARKLSQEQLAERADLHYTLIGSVERGERNVTLENLAKIAKGLGVPVRELFPVESKNDDSARELIALLATVDRSTSELILSVAKIIQEKRSPKPV
jgi:transcriptional regulator with XRE-family HTH domain